MFHLAALADIVPSMERPLDYHRANVNGTVALLEAARAAGVRRFLYAASSSCYRIYVGLPNRLFGLRVRYYNGTVIHRTANLKALPIKTSSFRLPG